MAFDLDLQSIQEARDLCRRAKAAQLQMKSFSQEQVDAIVKAMAEAGARENRRLAEMAVAETGFGIVEDKMIKNYVATEMLYNFIKSMKTVGVIGDLREKKVMEIAEPMGVVAAIVPSTNPTSTAMYKAIISVKARNAVVVSPHPSAKGCILEAVRVVAEAAEKAGAPAGAISCQTLPTREGTHELMKNRDTAVILATGGSGIVRAAHSVGKPAYGVGPGNVPAFIERSANIPKAVRDIIAGKTFDNGTVCASEQAIVTETVIAAQVEAEAKKQGGHFLSDEQMDALSRVVAAQGGGLNPAIVGKSVQTIAGMAGISVPKETRVLIARQTAVGKKHPLSMEKLSPILAYYVEPDWIAACHRCIELLEFGGVGHTLAIHSMNQEVIMEFALKKPVFRIVVNTPSTHGAIGATTGLDPAMTLGCGTWGGSITADNITPRHLLNIKRLAYGIRELEDFPFNPRKGGTTDSFSAKPGNDSHIDEPSLHRLSSGDIERIVREFSQRQK